MNFKNIYTILKWATYLFCKSDVVHSSEVTLLLKTFLSCVLYLEIFNFKFDVVLTVHRRQYVEIACQLDATEVFNADLIACSTCFGHHYAHHQELKSIMQWLLPLVFRAVVFKLLVWCAAEGCMSGLQDEHPQLHTRPAT